jgi:phospholipid/cholesterol/gamma-HCH transport system substrate-binding protein
LIQKYRSEIMRSRAVREGSLGLLILVGVLAAGGFVLWLRGASFGNSGFSFEVKLADSSGLDVGSPVRYRGAVVGKVQKLNPDADAVKVSVAIDNPQLTIPKNSAVETNQTGFLSNASIDIIPAPGEKVPVGILPTQADCQGKEIICQGDTIEGKPGVSFTQLMRETRVAISQITDQELIGNLNSTLKNAGEAAQSIKKLSDNANNVVKSFANPLDKFSNTADAIANAATNISKAASSAEGVVVDNKNRIAQTLDGISTATKDAQKLLAGAKPLFDDGKFINNLQKLSDNAAETADNLRKLSVEVNNPSTLATLRETLDSARATFANTQKITADLDELTGDPKFRTNIRSLVNGLSNLVSTGSNLVLPTAYSIDRSNLLAKQKSVEPSDAAK